MMRSKRHVELATGLAAVLCCCFVPGLAFAHPLSQGTLEVVVRPDRVDVRAHVTVEEASVTNMLAGPDVAPSPSPSSSSAPGSSPTPTPVPAPAASAGGYEQHARYLVAHLHVSADGKPLIGRIVRVSPPAESGATPSSQPSGASSATQNQRATYDFEYRPEAAPEGSSPHLDQATIQLTHNVLTDVDMIPGTKWDATYVVRIEREGRPAAEGLLLSSRQPVTFAGEVQTRWATLREYLAHGIMHILNGWDHLLFISALVLGAARLWDLVKVVSVFTLAHTITLTLATFDLVHLPGRVVEPMIAASIIFVAVQNVFWPRRSRGWGRLAAAFFFGLFHGLGFAGGLLEAMRGMSGGLTLVALAGFSVGVEVGHQMIVLPLFTALKLARRTRDDEEAKERLSLAAQRAGSAMISLAGVYYLVVALGLSFAPRVGQ